MKTRLRVVDGPAKGRELVMDERGLVVVGRAADLGFSIAEDPYLGRSHCVFDVATPRVSVRDLGSRNGTRVNGTRVREQVLRPGDEVRVGHTAIVFELIAHDADGTARDEPGPAHGRSDEPGPAHGRSDEPGLAHATSDEVRCTRCGEVQIAATVRGDDPVHYCGGCREALFAAPPMPEGHEAGPELGRGGNGRVYLARHHLLGERAVKLVVPIGTTTRRDREKLAREARLQFKVVHPRIVRVLDLTEVVPGVFAITMERVDGVPAGKLAGPDGRVDPLVAIAVAVQALEALDHAHKLGVVHRDVKESNLLVGRGVAGDLSVKLADFGLAKCFEDAGASGFTATGTWAGSGPYMSPEQLLDAKRVGPATDVYSLGVTLYHMLTGAYPREAPDEDWVVTILERDAVPIAQRISGVPPRLAAAIDRAVAREPSARWPSAAAMRTALLP